MAGTVTIEKTSKKYKFRLLIAALGIIVGVFWMVFAISNNDPQSGVQFDTNKPLAVLITSVLLWIVTKIQIWWNHG